MSECFHPKSDVKDSRKRYKCDFDYGLGLHVRRKRICTTCKEELFTYEINRPTMEKLIVEALSSRSKKEDYFAELVDKFKEWADTLPHKTLDKTPQL